MYVYTKYKVWNGWGINFEWIRTLTSSFNKLILMTIQSKANTIEIEVYPNVIRDSFHFTLILGVQLVSCLGWTCEMRKPNRWTFYPIMIQVNDNNICFLFKMGMIFDAWIIVFSNHTTIAWTNFNFNLFKFFHEWSCPLFL